MSSKKHIFSENTHYIQMYIKGDSGGPLVVNKFSPSSKKLIINDIESQW